MGEQARRRWKILASAIKSKRTEHVSGWKKVSVRRFASFGMFDVEPIEGNDSNGLRTVGDRLKRGCKYFSYSTKDLGLKIVVSTLEDSFKEIEDLMGFNNTGNVCIWPAEEILAHFVLSRYAEFTGKCVLEIGAGMSGLAGLFLAKKCGDLERMVITDGNPQSVEST